MMISLNQTSVLRVGSRPDNIEVSIHVSDGQIQITILMLLVRLPQYITRASIGLDLNSNFLFADDTDDNNIKLLKPKDLELAIKVYLYIFFASFHLHKKQVFYFDLSLMQKGRYFNCALLS